jgi:CTP:phosphocholine cytidylyltransferase-like protein
MRIISIIILRLDLFSMQPIAIRERVKVKVDVDQLKKEIYRKGVWSDKEYIILDGEVFKEDRCWFVNSRGEIQKSLIVSSVKHQSRIAFGNAFSSRKEAKKAVEILKEALIAANEISDHVTFIPLEKTV